jgi:hypothetical protein
LTHVLAHGGGGHTLKQAGLETLLLFVCCGLGVAAFRLREARVLGRPHLASRGLAVLAGAALVLAYVVPVLSGPPKIASVRPATDAKISILFPQPHQVLRGNPATIRVPLRVLGARIVTQTSTRLVPDKGHIHLYLDGALVTMVYADSATIRAYPGSHRLVAELVAVDHGPFRPPVVASVSFRVAP